MQKDYEIDALGLSNDKTSLLEEPTLDVKSYNFSVHEIHLIWIIIRTTRVEAIRQSNT
jgi:hypothetical protein